MKVCELFSLVTLLLVNLGSYGDFYSIMVDSAI